MAEATGFLYPFLGDAPNDPATLLADLSRSAAAKLVESIELRRTTLLELDVPIREAAAAVARAIDAGGRLFAIGNGGSATDAEAFVARCAATTPELPARSLATEPAVLTALANDIGVDAIFARQLAACARAGDVVVAFSTSGGSTNVLASLEEAKRRGILTVGIVGYGGGAMRAAVDHCLAVQSQSVHRVQEAQTAVTGVLVSTIAAAVGGRDPRGTRGVA